MSRAIFLAIAIAVMVGATQQVTMAQTDKTFEGDNNQNQSNCVFNCIATSSYENTIYGIRLRFPSDWSAPGIPVSGGLALGFLAGFVRTR